MLDSLFLSCFVDMYSCGFLRDVVFSEGWR